MKFVRLTAVALTAAAASCGGISVNSDYDPSFNFQTTQTFAVLDEAGGQSLDELMDARVKNSITRVMESKGFRQVADVGQADLAVGYQFTSEQRSTYQTVNSGWGGYGYGGWGGWYDYGPTMTTSTTTERRYEVGSLIIAVFDTEAEAMVYTSTGSGTLDSSQRSPAEMQERIDDAVEKILEDFPPGS